MKITKNFVQILSKLFYRKLIYRGMYAVHSGDRAGGFFVYIKEEDRGGSNAILYMPNPMEAIYIQKTEISMDIKFRNIRYVQKLPRAIYDVCKVNFTYYAKRAGTYAHR